MKFKFGVDSFIWAEDFKEKDLWIIEKAKEQTQKRRVTNEHISFAYRYTGRTAV